MPRKKYWRMSWVKRGNQCRASRSDNRLMDTLNKDVKMIMPRKGRFSKKAAHAARSRELYRKLRAIESIDKAHKILNDFEFKIYNELRIEDQKKKELFEENLPQHLDNEDQNDKDKGSNRNSQMLTCTLGQGNGANSQINTIQLHQEKQNFLFKEGYSLRSQTCNSSSCKDNVLRSQTPSANVLRSHTSSENVPGSHTTSANIRGSQSTSKKDMKSHTTSSYFLGSQSTSGNIRKSQTPTANIPGLQTISENIQKVQTPSANVPEAQTPSEKPSLKSAFLEDRNVVFGRFHHQFPKRMDSDISGKLKTLPRQCHINMSGSIISKSAKDMSCKELDNLQLFKKQRTWKRNAFISKQTKNIGLNTEINLERQYSPGSCLQHVSVPQLVKISQSCTHVLVRPPPPAEEVKIKSVIARQVNSENPSLSLDMLEILSSNNLPISQSKRTCTSLQHSKMPLQQTQSGDNKGHENRDKRIQGIIAKVRQEVLQQHDISEDTLTSEVPDLREESLPIVINDEASVPQLVKISSKCTQMLVTPTPQAGVVKIKGFISRQVHSDNSSLSLDMLEGLSSNSLPNLQSKRTYTSEKTLQPSNMPLQQIHSGENKGEDNRDKRYQDIITKVRQEILQQHNMTEDTIKSEVPDLGEESLTVDFESEKHEKKTLSSSSILIKQERIEDHDFESEKHERKTLASSSPPIKQEAVEDHDIPEHEWPTYCFPVKLVKSEPMSFSDDTDIVNNLSSLTDTHTEDLSIDIPIAEKNAQHGDVTERMQTSTRPLLYEDTAKSSSVLNDFQAKTYEPFHHVGRRKKLRRKLIDKRTQLSQEKMRLNWLYTKDLLREMEVAPQTKKLMLYKERSNNGNILSIPARLQFPSKLLKEFTRNLKTEPEQTDIK